MSCSTSEARVLDALDQRLAGLLNEGDASHARDTAGPTYLALHARKTKALEPVV